MDSSEEQESFSYTFLKPSHFDKKSKKADLNQLTPKEIGKKLQEKSIDPELFDIIAKDRNLILSSIDYLPTPTIPLVLLNLLTSLVLHQSERKNILQWIQVLLHSKQKTFLSKENQFNHEEIEKLLKLANLDSSISKNIHFLKGKCNLLFKRKVEKINQETENVLELENEEKAKPLLLKMTMQKPLKGTKKIKKKSKVAPPKKKKKKIAKKAETQTSESLSENSFKQITIKTQKNNVGSNKKKEHFDMDSYVESLPEDYFEF